MNTDNPKPPGRITGILAVLIRNLRVWKRIWLSSLVGSFTEPFLYLLALGYGLGALVAKIEGMSYIQFIAPGLVVSASMYAATFEGTYGTFTRMVPQHTFEGILSTPVGVVELLGGEVLYASVKAMTAGCCVLVVIALFGLTPSTMTLLVPLLSLLCGVLFGGLAVLASGLSPSYDFFNYYFTLVVTPMFLFSGIFFPLSQLPDWAQTVAWFSPLTHATSAARALVGGRLDAALLKDVFWLAVAAGLPLFPAVRLIRRRLIH